MKNLIIANWKCSPNNLKEAKNLFLNIKKVKLKNTEVVICPPFVYLGLLKNDNLGAQNVCFENGGAFTGEISAEMLNNLKVKYTIVGHSERRKYFNENNLDINKKIKILLEFGIRPILCIGETKQEFDMHLKPNVLETQITEGLKDINKNNIKNIIIAYEPIWAIGTGKNCSINETMTSILFIRKIISELYNKEIANNICIIYGGSVNSINSNNYIKNAGTNGLLVGGASLNLEEFIKILKLI